MAVGLGYFNAGVAHYEYPPKFAVSRPSIGMFCSPLDAEQHGYSASAEKYETPALDKRYGAGKYCVAADSPRSETAIRFPFCSQ